MEKCSLVKSYLCMTYRLTVGTFIETSVLSRVGISEVVGKGLCVGDPLAVG